MLEELAADIVADFTDEEGEPLAASEYAERAAERALPLVSVDLDVLYQLDEDEMTPAMPGDHRELWLLKAKVLVCRADKTDHPCFTPPGPVSEAAFGDVKVDGWGISGRRSDRLT